MTTDITVRSATPEDGTRIWELVKKTRVLDLNSPYLYILLGRHFADSCLLAERDHRPLGFVSAFRPPREPDTLFVWQIGVDPDHHGRGIATLLLQSLLDLPAATGIRWLETTITPSNRPSQQLFQALARERGAAFTPHGGFEGHLFPQAGHEDELCYRIGPFPQSHSLCA